MTSCGKPFTREDNCRRHMKRTHNLVDDELKSFYMDEETKRIKKERTLRGSLPRAALASSHFLPYPSPPGTL
jgi:hypothetical protein